MTFASWSTVRSRESVQIIRFVLQVLLPAEYLTCFRLNFLKNPVNEQEKWLSQSLVCHPGLRAWVQIPHTHVEWQCMPMGLALQRPRQEGSWSSGAATLPS